MKETPLLDRLEADHRGLVSFLRQVSAYLSKGKLYSLGYEELRAGFARGIERVGEERAREACRRWEELGILPDVSVGDRRAGGGDLDEPSLSGAYDQRRGSRCLRGGSEDSRLQLRRPRRLERGYPSRTRRRGSLTPYRVQYPLTLESEVRVRAPYGYRFASAPSGADDCRSGLVEWRVSSEVSGEGLLVRRAAGQARRRPAEEYQQLLETTSAVLTVPAEPRSGRGPKAAVPLAGRLAGESMASVSSRVEV